MGGSCRVSGIAASFITDAGLGGVMKNITRGTLAVVIVAAVFALVTWLCGAIILPHVLKDPVVRWTVATAAAIAVDALVAMWAYSFAKGGENGDTGPAKT